MMLTKRQQTNNPLIRRVHRHAALATLFRSSAADDNRSYPTRAPLILGQISQAAPLSVMTARDEAFFATDAWSISGALPSLTQLPVSSAPSPVLSAPSLDQTVPTVETKSGAVVSAAGAVSSLPQPTATTHAVAAARPSVAPSTMQAAMPVASTKPATSLSQTIGQPVSSSSDPVVSAATSLPTLAATAMTPNVQVARQVAAAGSPTQPPLPRSLVSPLPVQQHSTASAQAAGVLPPSLSPQLMDSPPAIPADVTGAPLPSSPSTTSQVLPPQSPRDQWQRVQPQLPQSQPTTDGLEGQTWGRLQAALQKYRSLEATDALPQPTASPAAASPLLRKPTSATAAPRRNVREIQAYTPAQNPPQPTVTSTSAPSSAEAVGENFVTNLDPSGVLPETSASAEPANLLGTSASPLRPASSSPRNTPTYEAQPRIGYGEEGEPLVRLDGVDVTSLTSDQAPGTQLGVLQRQGADSTPVKTDSLSTANVITVDATLADPLVEQSSEADKLASSQFVAPPTEETAEFAPDLLPLQAVWPVQRTELAIPTAPATEVTTAIDEDGGQPPFQPTPAISSTVRRQLETVETARPTEARVDIITPRRPRPVPLPSTARTEPSASVRQEVAPQPAAQPTEQALPSLPVEQRLIQTTVGPLPADLWTLIGEQPPQGVASQNEAPQGVKTGSSLLQRQTVPAEHSNQVANQQNQQQRVEDEQAYPVQLTQETTLGPNQPVSDLVAVGHTLDVANSQSMEPPSPGQVTFSQTMVTPQVASTSSATAPMAPVSNSLPIHRVAAVQNGAPVQRQIAAAEPTTPAPPDPATSKKKRRRRSTPTS